MLHTDARYVAEAKRKVLRPKHFGVIGLHSLLSTLAFPLSLLLTGAGTFTQT